MSGASCKTLAMRGTAMVAASAALITTACGSAQGTHRASDAPRRATVTIVAHSEANRAAAKGSWAWTPDVGVPFILAYAPSRAAAKIHAIEVGDVVHVQGRLAGTYTVTADQFDGRKDHDLYIETEGPNGVVDRLLLEAD